MAYKVKVYTFSKTGEQVLNKVLNIRENVFRCERLVIEKSEDNCIDEKVFFGYSAHVFIGATGIAVRKIAPFITNKKTDPAVIVIDEKGQNVIPVLSGHTGGANELSKLIAKNINARAVITTATDVNGYNAIDSIIAKSRLQMSPIDGARTVNRRILNGEKIKVYIDKDIEVLEDKSGVYEISDLENCDVAITSISNYVVGIGCRKNTDPDLFDKTFNEILKENNIRFIDIDRIVSIDIKENEEAIVRYARNNKIMFETYSADELKSVSGNFDESDFVKEITGVSNVSERACVYGANLMGSGEFVLKRQAVNGITVSIYKVVKRIDLNGKA